METVADQFATTLASAGVQRNYGEHRQITPIQFSWRPST